MLGTFIFFIYLFWNTYCFYLMYADKQKAVNGKRRISESSLINCAILFGAFGIAFGMVTFHHKTQKNKFILGVCAGIFLNIMSIFLLLRLVF